MNLGSFWDSFGTIFGTILEPTLEHARGALVHSFLWQSVEHPDLTKNKTQVALDSMATTWHWLTSGIDHSFPDGTTSPIVDWFRKNFISLFFLHL